MQSSLVEINVFSDSAYGRRYDPLISSAKSQKNIEENAIYTSSSLRLVGVTWQWGVALKLFRYRKNDPCDVACILFYGMQRGSTWSRTVLEAWIRKSCGLMGYDNYSPEQLTTFRGNMRDAIRLAYQKAGSQPPPSSSVIIPSNLLAVVSTFQAIPAVPPPLPPSNSHARSSSGPFLGFRSHHSHGSQLSVF